MNEGRLPNSNLPPARWDHPEQSWYDHSRYNWIGINKLPIDDLLIDYIPRKLPPEHTPNKQPIHPQQPDFI